MTGSDNAQQSANLVQNVDTSQIILGTPGAWSVSLAHAVIAAQPLVAVAAAGAGRAAVAAGPVPAGAGPLSAGQAALVQSAVNQSNAAAATTPSAASGSATTANTPADTITKVAQGITSIASTPANIKQLEAGTTATLHWWGWELDLNESATQALEALLTTDIEGLMSIGTALAFVSAPLAAVSGIISAVAGALEKWISDEDGDDKAGVVIKGYLWVAVRVTAA